MLGTSTASTRRPVPRWSLEASGAQGPAEVYRRLMRITYDAEVDAAYIYLTETPLMPGRDSTPVDPPDGVSAMVVLDWKDGRIVGP